MWGNSNVTLSYEKGLLKNNILGPFHNYTFIFLLQTAYEFNSFSCIQTSIEKSSKK